MFRAQTSVERVHVYIKQNMGDTASDNTSFMRARYLNSTVSIDTDTRTLKWTYIIYSLIYIKLNIDCPISKTVCSTVIKGKNLINVLVVLFIYFYIYSNICNFNSVNTGMIL